MSLNQIGFTDEELVHCAKEGSHDAYEDLCRRHNRLIFSMANRIVKNHADAEDIAQETFLKAFLHLDTFDGRSRFSTWLTRIAINTALMSVRKRKSHRTQLWCELSHDDSGACTQFPCGLPDPEQQVAQAETVSQLQRAVQRLPPLLREVSQLRYCDDLPVGDIAALIGISVPATKSRLSRGRAMVDAATQRMRPRVAAQHLPSLQEPA